MWAWNYFKKLKELYKPNHSIRKTHLSSLKSQYRPRQFYNLNGTPSIKSDIWIPITSKNLGRGVGKHSTIKPIRWICLVITLATTLRKPSLDSVVERRTWNILDAFQEKIIGFGIFRQSLKIIGLKLKLLQVYLDSMHSCSLNPIPSTLESTSELCVPYMSH